MKPLYGALKDHGVTFSLVHINKSNLPSVQAIMEDGTKLTGSFTLGANRIGKVSVEEIKPLNPKPVTKKDDQPRELIKPK